MRKNSGTKAEDNHFDEDHLLLYCEDKLAVTITVEVDLNVIQVNAEDFVSAIDHLFEKKGVPVTKWELQ